MAYVSRVRSDGDLLDWRRGDQPWTRTLDPEPRSLDAQPALLSSSLLSSQKTRVRAPLRKGYHGSQLGESAAQGGRGGGRGDWRAGRRDGRRM